MIDWQFIRDLEGAGILMGYVPAPDFSDSGVTIATGVDLGQRTPDEIDALAISSALKVRLKPYAGLRGQAAVAFLAQNPLQISQVDSDALDMAVQGEIVGQLARRYDAAVTSTPGLATFSLLSDAKQTVLASVAFQYGPALDRRCPRFCRAATLQIWTDVISELRNFGDAYPTRRNKEADSSRVILDRKVIVMMHAAEAENQTAGPALTRRRLVIGTGALVLGLIGAVRPSVAQMPPGVVFFDPEFKARTENFDAELKRERTPIQLPSGRVVRSCPDFFEYKDVRGQLGDRRLADYQICFAIQALRRAKAPTREISTCYRNPEQCDAAEMIEKRLDLRSFPNSFGPRLPSKAEPISLARLDVPVKQPSRYSLVMEQQDWLFKIDALASADFDGRGAEQWLARFVDRSKDAEYFIAGFLIINGPGSGEWMTARSLGP